MPRPDRLARHSVTAALLLATAACSDQSPAPVSFEATDTAAISGNVAASAGDPALTAALRDQIMVDPALVRQANADAVRPPTMPESGAVPPDGIAVAAMRPADPGETLRPAPPPAATCPQCDQARRALTSGALAAGQPGATGRCAASLSYSASWANRLPAGVPLYPDARVAEAAGNDANGCALRIVSFRSNAAVQRLLDWYYTRTSGAGFNAQHGSEGKEHVLAGTRANGSAFLLVVRALASGGSDVDLIANGG